MIRLFNWLASKVTTVRLCADDETVARLTVYAKIKRGKKTIYYCEQTVISRSWMVTHSELWKDKKMIHRSALDRPMTVLRGDKIQYFHVAP